VGSPRVRICCLDAKTPEQLSKCCPEVPGAEMLISDCDISVGGFWLFQ